VTQAARVLRTPAGYQADAIQPAGAHVPAAQTFHRPPAAEPIVDDDSESERRSAARLAHDRLVRSLRDPDPRVRAEAFVKLRESPRP
jgi:hypothetical protein